MYDNSFTHSIVGSTLMGRHINITYLTRWEMEFQQLFLTFFVMILFLF